MNITEAWQKLTGEPVKVGRAGVIPVFDKGEWRFYRNTATIWPGVENVADPEKVEKMRRNVVALLEAFPDTIPELEKLGIRVRGLLNKTIKTQADIAAWSEGFFNTGPVQPVPVHVQDAMNLAHGDFKIQVRMGRHPAFVLPVAPRESGVKQTMDFTVPGSKVRYGPRHEFTKTAFSPQTPQRTEADKRAQAKDVLNGAVRGRGRPRKDGLMPGSREAIAADKKRQRERERTKRHRVTKPEEELATITELPQPQPQRRILVRVGKTASGDAS